MDVAACPLASACEITTFAERYETEFGSCDVCCDVVVALVDIDVLIFVGLESKGELSTFDVGSDIAQDGRVAFQFYLTFIALGIFNVDTTEQMLVKG